MPIETRRQTDAKTAEAEAHEIAEARGWIVTRDMRHPREQWGVMDPVTKLALYYEGSRWPFELERARELAPVIVSGGDGWRCPACNGGGETRESISHGDACRQLPMPRASERRLRAASEGQG